MVTFKRQDGGGVLALLSIHSTNQPTTSFYQPKQPNSILRKCIKIRLCQLIKKQPNFKSGHLIQNYSVARA